ncbi:MAG: hydrogenase maturation nickel metallochaperone HypA [Acidobacteriota bacterium]|nr:hydrogenase maturation nickel metallochaperone HypA [Acidobacteriota bacterium]
MSIVDTAQEEAERNGWKHIHAVHLKLGRLSGVVKDALLSSYEMACESTALQGSRLIIEEISVEVFCPKCEARRPVQSIQWFCCPECGTATGDVVQGKELQVVGLEITE